MISRGGPKKKPAEVHKNQGTYRADRHLPDAAENFVPVLHEPPTAPAKLSDNAKKYWFLILRQMIDNKIFADADTALVEILCCKLDQHDEAVKNVSEEGMVSIVTNSKGTTYPMPNPNLNIARTLTKEIMELTSHLGLSPLARTQIGVVNKKPDDPMKNFFKGK